MDSAIFRLQTAPATSGAGLYFLPAKLPGPEDLNADWYDLATNYAAQYADLQTLKDKLATRRRELVAAQDYIRLSSVAKREGKPAPKDNRESAADKVAEAQSDVHVQEQVLVDLTLELENWRQEIVDDLVNIPRLLRAEIGERAPRVVAEAQELFDSFNAARRTEAWVLGQQPPGPQGSKVVNDLDREIRKTITPARVVYISQPEMLKLRAGKDARSVDGEVLTHAQVDAGMKDGTILPVIAHGSPRSVQGLRAEYD